MPEEPCSPVGPTEVRLFHLRASHDQYELGSVSAQSSFYLACVPDKVANSNDQARASTPRPLLDGMGPGRRVGSAFGLGRPAPGRRLYSFSFTASSISTANAASSTLSSLKKSMARTELLPRRALKRRLASVSSAPLGKVNLTALLSSSPIQTIFP